MNKTKPIFFCVILNKSKKYIFRTGIEPVTGGDLYIAIRLQSSALPTELSEDKSY